jgi:DNA-binding NarL/FixJ family response regulator
MLESIRVLVVEDFEPIRNSVCLKLQTDPKLQVVGEVSDGLEAVQKAEELQPELILLDIGLPTLNGLQAARLIRKVSPSSKIVFVSQESSTEVIEEALRIGANGYIAKTDLGRELLPGVGIILSGNIFISSLPAHSNGGLAAVLHRSTRSNPHVVAVYRDDAALVNGLTRCISSALNFGSAVIAAVTASHWNSLLHMLSTSNSEIDNDVRQGKLVFLDVAEACATFAIGDQANGERFSAAGNFLDRAAAQANAESPRVFVCGECPSILLAEGTLDAAIEIELLWNDFSKIIGDIALHCAYLSAQFESKDKAHIFERVCEQHSVVLGW